MKVLKFVGIFLTIIGIFFTLIGTIKYISVLSDIEDRVYTTATIVKIDEYLTGESDNLKGYNVYVEIEVNNENVRSELNTCSSKYHVGDKVSIYYYEDNMDMVYKENSEHFLLVFPLVGVLFSIIGFVLLFNKKVQNKLIKIPVSETM